MKNINFLLFFLLLTGFLIGAPIPYSGKVAINGANFQGDAQFTFALRDANGTEHWRNGANANDSIELTVDRGLYVCLLGGNTMNDFPAKLFLNHSELYLQVRFYRVDTQKWLHLLPDQRITSAPHALAAEVANLAKLADAVRPGAITKSMLGDEVLADLNRTVTKSMLGQDVLADLNQTIGTDSITLDKLSPQVRADLNGTIARSRFPSDVLADLNRTVTKSMLGQDVLADLNQTIGTDSITLDKLSPQVRADLNRTVTATDIAANTITTAQLNESILRYLKPEITQSPQAPARVYTGQTVTLASQSEGKYLTYQWKKNGIDLSGETNATLIITEANATLHDGNYTLEVSNDFGSVSAQSVTLDVNATAILHHVQSASNLEMLWVSSGTFTMGSPTSEAGRGTNEDEHTATLTNGFYLGKYEVTQVQYEAVMTGNSNQLSATPSQYSGDDNRPVEKVSWNDVQVFLTRLNAAEQAAGRLPTGWSYVLPTESEWEYACRAGTTTTYSWGNSIATSNANYVESGIGQTRDMGQYSANPWGFFDMHGNVSEWTADRYAVSYPTGSATDPIGPTTGSFRVVRGGSWGNSASNARSAIRFVHEADYRNRILGFRVGFRYAGGVSQLSLLGDANATHVGGMAWVDPGFTATDAEDGNLTSQVTVTGAVNANATGTYVLHYTVMDSKGNIAATTRTVNVSMAATRVVAGASNLQMLWVEPGTFTMGSPTSEAGRVTSETEHNVTLTNGFYLGKYEVTQAQYEAVMTGNSNSLSATPSQWPGNANRPVEKVSWSDIQVFLTRLNAAEQAAGRLSAGWQYVLPTESEWEYACRAGITTAYSWGNDVNSTHANWDYGNDANQTVNVGQYAANPWGFYDMHGNVWEWLNDWKANYPGGAQTDPEGPASGSHRVKRGGSWNYPGSYLRSAKRNLSTPGTRVNSLGFRVGFKAVQPDVGNPELDLFGGASITREASQPWIDPDFEAHDVRDGILTASVTVSGTVDMNSTGTYVLTYSVSDAAGNGANATRTVTVADTTAPVVTLLGDANFTHTKDVAWVDPGATATDTLDGNLTNQVTISGTVDVNSTGAYVLTYSVSDGAGNEANATRTVNVGMAATYVVEGASNLQMLWVEPGTFTMGSPTSEAGRETNEAQHNVTLTNGFYLGKYEVTQAQYEAVMTGNTNTLEALNNPATPSQFANNPNRPVERVHWNNIQVFLTRLNAAEQAAGRLPAGWQYVLPTESEWEYACRAGTTTVYSWGNSIGTSNANYSSSGIGQTRDVGQYAANPWGFFDMHGNVHEWTSDWYASSYPAGSATDPTGPTTGSAIVIRGGNYGWPGSYARSATRRTSPPGGPSSVLGFRLSLGP